MYGVDLIAAAGSPVDWPRVRAGGRTFGYVRASNGTSLDPAFADEWRAMREHEVTRGAWHQLHADEDAAEQALRFLKVVELVRGDLPPMLDLERMEGVAPTLLVAMVSTWTAVVEAELEARHGCVPRTVLRTSARAWPRGLPTEFGERALWVVDPLRFDAPSVPGPWLGDDWLLHQYTVAGRGVPGIVGYAQLDRFHACGLGDRGRRVRQVRQLLRADEGDVFDEQLQATVMQFQIERGLVNGGIVGPRTFAELHWPSG